MNATNNTTKLILCKGPQLFDWLFFNLVSPCYLPSGNIVYVSLRPVRKKTNTHKRDSQWATAEQISCNAAWKANVSRGKRRGILCKSEEQTESTLIMIFNHTSIPSFWAHPKKLCQRKNVRVGGVVEKREPPVLSSPLTAFPPPPYQYLLASPHFVHVRNVESTS